MNLETIDSRPWAISPSYEIRASGSSSAGTRSRNGTKVSGRNPARHAGGPDVALHVAARRPAGSDELRDALLFACRRQQETDAARHHRGCACRQRAFQARIGLEERLDIIMLVEHQQHVSG